MPVILWSACGAVGVAQSEVQSCVTRMHLSIPSKEGHAGILDLENFNTVKSGTYINFSSDQGQRLKTSVKVLSVPLFYGVTIFHTCQRESPAWAPRLPLTCKHMPISCINLKSPTRIWNLLLIPTIKDILLIFCGRLCVRTHDFLGKSYPVIRPTFLGRGER